MIRISYLQVPNSYLSFIEKFKIKLKKWINKGEIGNVNSRVSLCRECELIFRFLIQNDHLKRFLLIPAEDLPSFIEWVETRFPLLATDRFTKGNPPSDLFKCLAKAFDLLGYRDSAFPRFDLSQESGVRACPYCNAEEIIVRDLGNGGPRIRSAQLDHFYPRELFPYLAISLYNLIPSGSLCNGVWFKYRNDSYAQHLLNPFALRDSNGFLFELDIIGKGVLDRNTFCSSCKIVTNVVYPSLSVNESVFEIRLRYEKEIKQAQIVWEKHKEVESKGYRNAVSEKAKAVGVTLSFKEWMESELQINPDNFNDKKLSKLSMDIWWQLERMHI